MGSLPSSLPSSPSRSVSFSELEEVQEIIRRDEYTPSEKFLCWYWEEEIIQIRREAAHTVARMNAAATNQEQEQEILKEEDEDESSSTTTQGLECRTRIGRQRRRDIRMSSMAAVFDARETRWLFGGFDGNEGGFEEVLAVAYKERSVAARDSALQRASMYRKELLEEEESVAKAEQEEAAAKAEEETRALRTATTKAALFHEEDYHCRHEIMEDRGDDDNNHNNKDNNNRFVRRRNSDGDSCLWKLRDRFACLLPSSQRCQQQHSPSQTPTTHQQLSL